MGNNFFEGLTEYRISLHENKGDKFILYFDCWAEDACHAEEQTINAYPNGEIKGMVEKAALL
jgi:hypothetical protein